MSISPCRACRRHFSLCRVVRASENSKVYSKTLRLPRTQFPQWCDPQKSEIPFRIKTTGDLYKWQEKNAEGPLFILHDGPPYANGNLHIGHAMNKILKDIINRFHLLQGRRINYIPGWDCHGLPIETKTLKELKKEAHELPAHVIRKAARSVAEREIETQKREFQELGIMAEWSREGTYQTLDNSYELRQLRLFQKMVEKGLIYRSYRPVHYSPSSRSALAEAELIYRDDHVSRSVYVLFSLNDSSVQPKSLPACDLINEHAVKLMVWTTTPWTLTANMGIAVNSEMIYSLVETTSREKIIVSRDRLSALTPILGEMRELSSFKGSELVGLSYRPLFSDTPRAIAPFRIIPAPHVTPESGTGLVHCAPAHGAEDYAAFRALGLLGASSSSSLVCHVDEQGCFANGVVDAVGSPLGKRLVGLDVLVRGTDALIDALKESGSVLVKEEKIRHKYPYDWKTDMPIIVTATSQWFASLDSLKDDALVALKGVDFYPPESRNRLESFIRSRSEWCISRQRVWGVPIPSLYHRPTGEAILNTDTLSQILFVLETKGPEYWWDGAVADFIPPSMRRGLSDSKLNEEWTKGTDTMDVWFDSGSSWSLLAERGLRSASDGAQAYADVCLEGSDQHRGWFQSMLLTAVASSGSGPLTVPYRTLITHGMVLDQEGKKMSKSLGNVISPMTIVRGGKDQKKDPAYGADTLRFWTASVEFWRDVPLGPTVLSQAVESLRKIRNTMRFILGNIGERGNLTEHFPLEMSNFSVADRYVMFELLNLEKFVVQCYNDLNFARVTQSISYFCNVTLSALYFDITKDILYANRVDSIERRAVVVVLDRVVERLMLMLAPITPHLAEEIFYYRNNLVEKSEGPSVFTMQWQPLSADAGAGLWDDERVAKEMEVLMKIRDGVNGLLEIGRSNKKLRSSLEAEVDIIVPDTKPPRPSWLSEGSLVADTLLKNEEFLKTLFIVSDVDITDEGSLGAAGEEWVFSSSLELSNTSTGETESLGIRVRPAKRAKCPRCWSYTRPESEELCERCNDAVKHVNEGTSS